MITMQYFMEDIKEMTPKQAFEFITSFYEEIVDKTETMASDIGKLEEEYENSIIDTWNYYNFCQYEEEYLLKECQIEECWRQYNTKEAKEIEEGLNYMMEDKAEKEAAYNFVMYNKSINYIGLNVNKVAKYITIYGHDLECIYNNELSTLPY